MFVNLQRFPFNHMAGYCRLGGGIFFIEHPDRLA
jgi:hypothetical protein